MRRKEYKPWELEFIATHHGKMSSERIARRLGRSRAAVDKQKNLMGLTACVGNYETTGKLLSRLFYDSEYERTYIPPFRARNSRGV